MSSFVFRLIKVALFGPPNSGKTTFLRQLLQEDIHNSSEIRVVEVLRVYELKTPVIGVKRDIKYRLCLIDLPGKEDLADERINALKGVSGYLLFYDATNPNSAKVLGDMIRNELEERKKLGSALAIIVVGTKKDLNVSRKALEIAEGIVNNISRYTLKNFGYMIPHLLISCMDKEEVELVIRAIETIFFEIRTDLDILRRLGVRLEPLNLIARSLNGLKTIDLPMDETRDFGHSEQH